MLLDLWVHWRTAAVTTVPHRVPATQFGGGRSHPAHHYPKWPLQQTNTCLLTGLLLGLQSGLPLCLPGPGNCPAATSHERANLTIWLIFHPHVLVGVGGEVGLIDEQTICVIGQEPLSILQLWRNFCSLRTDFISSFAAYQHFRSKGWIPKGGSGAKYGVDFCKSARNMIAYVFNSPAARVSVSYKVYFV